MGEKTVVYFNGLNAVFRVAGIVVFFILFYIYFK